MPKTKIHSEQTPCVKCLKKHGEDLNNWQPCANCPWISKQIDLTKPKETLSTELEDFLVKQNPQYTEYLISLIQQETNSEYLKLAKWLKKR